MKLLKTFSTVLIGLILTGCGGGDSPTPTPAPTSSNIVHPIDTKAKNIAWENAKVYRPFTRIPVSISELSTMPPSPVAISLHGCDGVQEGNLSLGDKYYPIFLALQGYLVIEPDSYPGMKQDPNSFTKVCYKDPKTGLTVYPATINDIIGRKFDAEYAIAKISEGSFWDKKTLLVQGQSQGFQVAFSLNSERTKPVTKWLLSGLPIGCEQDYRFTNNQPTLIVNSDFDLAASPYCIDILINKYLNIKVKLIQGSFHSPISSSEGQAIIKEWVKI